MGLKSISEHSPAKSSAKPIDRFVFLAVCLLLLLYMGIFTYLNLFGYTRHVDSDIAVEALLAREIWVEKDLTPNNWISSTERRVVGVSAVAAPFYGLSGSMVFSTGVACVIVGGLLLLAIAFTLRRCQISRPGVAVALLALCCLPVNGLRNDGQMVPFVMLLWFLFADYYAMHSICLFLCIAFYLYLRESVDKRKLWTGCVWLALTAFCGGLALGGMRCLQVVVLPLFIWEMLLLFFESDHMAKPLPRQRLLSTGFILSLLAAGLAAALYPTNVDYPLYIEDAGSMTDRLIHDVPAAVLECLGIAGGCKVGSLASLMQLGILAVLALTVYGILLLFSRGNGSSRIHPPFPQKALIQALGASFLFTVFVEIATSAETAPNYFFAVWFVVVSALAVLVTHFGKTAPHFARLIALCVCIFAVCNIFYTYRDCITAEDNLQEYEEVIAYMESEDISCGYAQFWDASRICIMTDGRITMGHCYQMSDLRMYWWLTSTKWYVPALPERMPTAYVVRVEEKDAFEAQFEDPDIVAPGFENDRFIVYTSAYNLVPMT